MALQGVSWKTWRKSTGAHEYRDTRGQASHIETEGEASLATLALPAKMPRGMVTERSPQEQQAASLLWFGWNGGCSPGEAVASSNRRTAEGKWERASLSGE